MPRPELQIRRWKRLEYERLVDKGVFEPGERVELIDGLLVVAEPQSSPHYTSIRLVERAPARGAGPIRSAPVGGGHGPEGAAGPRRSGVCPRPPRRSNHRRRSPAVTRARGPWMRKSRNRACVRWAVPVS